MKAGTGVRRQHCYANLKIPANIPPNNITVNITSKKGNGGDGAHDGSIISGVQADLITRYAKGVAINKPCNQTTPPDCALTPRTLTTRADRQGRITSVPSRWTNGPI